MNDDERDTSDAAILRRYRLANEFSIVTVNPIVFNSLRDIFFLVNERKKLLKRIEELERKTDDVV